MDTSIGVKVTIKAKIINADGTEEDLGVIASSDEEDD